MKICSFLFILFLLFFASAVIVGVQAQPGTPASELSPDSLIIHEGASSFAAGSFDGMCLKDDAVTLSSTDGKSRGLYTSPVIQLTHPAQQIIPSWNILCAPKEGWLVQLRVKNTYGETSPWFYLGSDGESLFSEEKIMKCPWAKVAVDAIILEKPAITAQYRVILQGLRSSPFLTLFALASRHAPPLIDSEPDPDLMGKVSSLPVPYRSQCVEAKSIASRVCCPTSTSMILEFLGVNLPTAHIAERLYNKENDIYGIWWGPPQLACQYGLKGWVRLFSHWKSVQQVLAEGQPIIASISFGIGELKGSPVSSTKGHIVVVTGFDNAGRVLVNDPAGKSADDGRIAYDSRQFARAWFGHGGVAMIIRKKD